MHACAAFIIIFIICNCNLLLDRRGKEKGKQEKTQKKKKCDESDILSVPHTPLTIFPFI